MSPEQAFKAGLRRRSIQSQVLWLLKQSWGFSPIDYDMAWRNMDDSRREKYWKRATQLVDLQSEP